MVKKSSKKKLSHVEPSKMTWLLWQARIDGKLTHHQFKKLVEENSYRVRKYSDYGKSYLQLNGGLTPEQARLNGLVDCVI